MPLALALALALSSANVPAELAPRLDPGPFRGPELAAASAGAFTGDALVIGAGYLTLRLFANDTISPTAANFRTAAYALAAAAVVVPPLTGALFARWARARPASGAFWKALLLASVGQVAALGVGYLASPHYWVILPAQFVTISLGASLGLHWGPRTRPRAAPLGAPGSREAPGAPADGAAATLAAPVCPDPALAIVAGPALMAASGRGR